MNLNEALKFVQDNITEEDASIVLHAMKREFGWTGTVFCEDDIRQSIADRREADDKEPYSEEQMDEAVATVMDSRGWSRYMEDWMTEQGWDFLSNLIFDEVEYPEEQEDN